MEAAAWVQVDDLEAWALNPRENDGVPVERVARSILRFGFVAPVVAWREERRIIAGHTRIKAYRSLMAEHGPGWAPRGAPGPGYVPVRYHPFESEEEASAYAIADNRLAELAAWDLGVLDDLESDLTGLEDLSRLDLGWTDDEWDDLHGSGEGAGSGSGGGEGGEPGEDPRTSSWTPPEPRVDIDVRLHAGDCLDMLEALPDASVDCMVTDPPYGLSAPPDMAEVLRAWLDGRAYEHGGVGFMGAEWDKFVPGPHVWRECLRVLKPGAHGIVFAGTRTVDLMGIALRLGGFEIRDVVHWAYFSGFPKSHDASKAIDDVLGAEREIVSSIPSPGRQLQDMSGGGAGENKWTGTVYGGPVTREAVEWDGWGSALKPCIEPAILVRKPLEAGSIARQVLATGTGAINIDGSRFPPGDPAWLGPNEDLPTNHGESGVAGTSYSLGARDPMQTPGQRLGRFPANLIYCPKPNRRERDRGCEALDTEETRNTHPTVKPVGVMRRLARLILPPGGSVLEPFLGSGTTAVAALLEGASVVHAAEAEEVHVQISEARIAHARAYPEEWATDWTEDEGQE